MEDLFMDFEFNKSTNYKIKEIDGMPLPNDYLEFMKKHNGGVGCVGKNSYMNLKKLEELIEFNKINETTKWLPNCFCFGGDGGGNQFCYNFITKEYFAVDCCAININDNYCRASSLNEFITKWDNTLDDI